MEVNPEAVAKLKWIDDLFNSPEWPKLRDHLLLEVETMKEEGMLIGPVPTKRQENILKLCGLHAPSNSDEEMRVYIAVRAVATYMTNKIKLLEANREVFKTGVRALREQENSPASEKRTA